MKIVLAHPGCGPFIQQTVAALWEKGWLDYYATTVVDHPEELFSKILKKILRPVMPEIEKLFSRKELRAVPLTKCRPYPWKEGVRLLAVRMNLHPYVVDVLWEWSELAFDRWVARGLRPDIDAVYVYEHAGLETMRKAKAMGKTIFYEQPTPHWAYFDQTLRCEIKKNPALRDAHAELSINKKSARRNQRRDHELALADFIICNSQFTKRTLIDNGVAEKKIVAVPLGFPDVEDGPPGPAAGKVIFFNAGTQCVRKGSHILYQAWKNLSFSENEAELWIAGSIRLPRHLLDNLPGKVKYLGAISRQELMARYGQAAVFVFPSLAEGFGMVITEAMSRGLPVITTDCTAGPDFIQQGRNGWLIPAGNVEALMEQMRWCAQNPDRLPAYSQAALESARKWSWSHYRKAITDAIGSCFELGHFENDLHGKFE